LHAKTKRTELPSRFAGLAPGLSTIHRELAAAVIH
jgi:hypothetical protein